MNRSRILALLLIAGTVTACSTQEPGTPSAAPPQDTEGTKTSGSPSTGPSLDELDPCDVLTEIAPKNDLTDMADADSNGCSAKNSKGVRVQLDVYPTLGISQYQAGANSEISETTVGGRAAKLVKKTVTDLDCTVTIEVTSSSRVDVTGYSISSIDDSCATAQALAKDVEPELPKS
ncbi:DUF3558 domain-containing protein [Actinosynnema sp.]|uniref:DUF3558 domain-containing protein n=1 Tax=Actinosynnema sp. TaxID=1872144 RepID=UPI003F860D62